MKKLLGIFVLVLLLSGNAYAENLTFVCQWKNGKNVYEIIDGKVYDDAKLIKTSFLKVSNRNVEFKYKEKRHDRSLVSDDDLYPSSVFNIHFKLNLKTGQAFETQISVKGTSNDSFHAKCEVI